MEETQKIHFLKLSLTHLRWPIYDADWKGHCKLSWHEVTPSCQIIYKSTTFDPFTTTKEGSVVIPSKHLFTRSKLNSVKQKTVSTNKLIVHKVEYFREQNEHPFIINALLSKYGHRLVHKLKNGSSSKSSLFFEKFRKTSFLTTPLKSMVVCWWSLRKKATKPIIW